jgi:uncharacterized protein (TIGR03790 family)
MLHFVLLLCVFTTSCGPQSVPIQPDPRSSHVLVVQNANSSDSQTIAKYYLEKRAIPPKNLVTVRVPDEENLPTATYELKVRDVIRNYITSNALKIDFIVLTKGVPIRLDNNQGYSLDAFLMVDAHPARQNVPLQPLPFPLGGSQVQLTEQEVSKVTNPYLGSKEPFDSNKYRMYLVTRLDGYSKEDAMKLVDSSITATGQKGLFLLDSSPGKRSGGGYAEMEKLMQNASKLLKAKGFAVEYDENDDFIGQRQNIMGYASWGSNDGHFHTQAYRSLMFRPGAIAETFVSTSARTFRRTESGQSLIADLIEQGVTGIKGYVSEPYTFALARVDLLFDRYTSGLNLAESFYAASMILKWKDVVIGDPLCSPYKAKGKV